MQLLRALQWLPWPRSSRSARRRHCGNQDGHRDPVAEVALSSAQVLPERHYPRLLTIHGTGNQYGAESGCVAVDGSAGIVIGSGACPGFDAPVNGNGVTNVGRDEPFPRADNHKYGIPSSYCPKLSRDAAGLATSGNMSVTRRRSYSAMETVRG